MSKGYEQIGTAAQVLGSLFYADPASSQCDKLLSWIREPNTPAAWEFGQPQAQAALETMAKSLGDNASDVLHDEYNRLFIGPYSLPAPPWGSVYTDPESVIFGNQTLAVRQWMRDNLIKINLSEKEPEDQFGLMLLMLAWSVANDVSDEAIDAFFEEHLLPWAPRFLDLFEEGAELGFYAGLAQLARATLLDWKDRFGLNPIVVPLAR